MLQYYGKKKSRLTVRVLVGRYLITRYVLIGLTIKKLTLDETVTITGKWDQHRQTIAVSELHFGPVVRQQEVEPVYSVKGKLTVKQMRRFIAQALKEYGDSIVEVLPDGLLGRYKLLPRYEALKALHFPVGQEDLKQASPLCI